MDKDLQEFVALLDAVEKAGINSVRKLKMFIKFGSNQGKSMSELAGRAKTPEYTEVQQAVIELSVGRYNALMSPKLVVLGRSSQARPNMGDRWAQGALRFPKTEPRGEDNDDCLAARSFSGACLCWRTHAEARGSPSQLRLVREDIAYATAT